jgi:hypothetical protein
MKDLYRKVRKAQRKADALPSARDMELRGRGQRRLIVRAMLRRARKQVGEMLR